MNISQHPRNQGIDDENQYREYYLSSNYINLQIGRATDNGIDQVVDVLIELHAHGLIITDRIHNTHLALTIAVRISPDKDSFSSKSPYYMYTSPQLLASQPHHVPWTDLINESGRLEPLITPQPYYAQCIVEIAGAQLTAKLVFTPELKPIDKKLPLFLNF